MTGSDGYLNRSTRRINDFPKSLVEHFADNKIHALLVLGLVGFVAAPDAATLE